MNKGDVNKNLPIPTHLAIIMDGNGRWAQKRGLERYLGHLEGSKAAENIILHCNKIGIRYVTLYAFSNENWQRPKDEVDFLIDLLEEYLNKEASELIKNGIKIRVIGDIYKLPITLQKSINTIVNKTKNCKKMDIILALSYGSLEEITATSKKIVEEVLEGRLDIKNINEKVIKDHLYTNDIPDPDLLIRTGAEIRLSNFLLLQLSYSELYFSKKMWPDFREEDLNEALIDFGERIRRFGKTKKEG